MKFYIIAFISLWIFSCKTPDISFYDLNTSKLLEPGRVIYETNEAGVLSELKVTDSLLIAIDPIGEKKIIFIHLFTGKEILKFGEEGRGPNNFLSPDFLVNDNIINADSSHITLFDINLMRFYYADPHRILTEPDYQIPIKNFPAKIIGNTNLNITGSKIIGKSSSLKSQGMFFIYDTRNEQQKWIDYYPDPRNIAVLHRNYAFNMHIAANKDRIIGAMTFMDMLQVFDTTGNRIRFYQFSDNIIPTPEMTQGNCPVYFTKLYATPNNCYFARIGYHTNSEENRKNGTYIIQADWNGNIVKSYKAGQFLYGFCIDETHNKLFGICSEDQDTFQIIEYSL